MRKLFAVFVIFCVNQYVVFAQEKDLPFLQPISIKYLLPESLKDAVVKKVVIDYNDVVYVLTDKGLCMVSGDKLVKDIRYTPLAQKIPLDVTTQEESGHLYYLYEDKLLTNGYAGVPCLLLPKGKYNRLAVNRNGDAFLAGETEMAIARKGKLASIHRPDGKLLSICAKDNVFYVLTSYAVYRFDGKEFQTLHKGDDLKAISFRGDELVIATSAGYYGINKLNGDSTFSLQTKLPSTDISCLAIVNNKVWAGTSAGAFMREPSGACRYYASRRWLNDDRVIDIAVDSKGNIYALTSTGLNQVSFLSQTLEQKTAYFQDRIRQRHIRYGFISNVTFKVPGDISTAQLTDTDNDGLWSAFYLGSQSFRYAVTKDPAAKRYAWECFEAFERILSVNPLDGFPARTFERKGYKNSDPKVWHDSQDPEWEWKGTTSSDEFVGYIFIAAVLNEMVVETESEKKRVAGFMDKILMHIIRNNYYLIDADGKPTLWGRWNPEYINSIPQSVGDRKLGSTTIIAGLELGYALTGKEIYKTEAARLMNEHGYLKNMQTPYSAITVTPGVIHMGVNLGEGGWNHSDDEMAFLTYWVLYRYAFNDSLKQQYISIIHDHWQMEKPERNAVWNLVSLGTGGSFDEASTLWHLREFPMDLIRWNVKNSQRKDIELLPPNFRKQYTKELLPPGEMPMHRHNSNAFDLDGGENGYSELAGDEYLLPYWMARYLKVIN